MAFKRFLLANNQPVNIYKRRTNRSLRLSVNSSGDIRVSIPLWASYASGLAFAQSRQAWITNQIQPAILLVAGQPVGKAHHLRIYAAPGTAKVRSRVLGTEIVVSHPSTLAPSSREVQQLAEAACIRALRREAESLLPQRLATLASAHGFSYKGVTIKRLKSRWGSCDQHTNIVLNLFLIQLPWDYIDYVLLHELTHTNVLHHGPDFWSAMTVVLPTVPQLRKAMRTFQPILYGPDPTAVA
jgi:predicted metal-dependent hydrolase